MNNTYFNLKVNSIPAGQFFKMAYVSDVTLSALGRKAGVSVLKRVIGTYRIGVNYKHTKKAIAKAAEKNIPIDTASKLPWGQWKDNSNRIICHTNKKGEYNEYLRVYDTPNKPNVQHYLNGKPISKEPSLGFYLAGMAGSRCAFCGSLRDRPHDPKGGCRLICFVQKGGTSLCQSGHGSILVFWQRWELTISFTRAHICCMLW